jgi:amidase
VTEPLDLDAVGQADLVRRKDVSPRELVDAAIARIEARNPEINAVIHERFDAARDEASGPLPDGPFRGVPFLLKDGLADMAGEPSHFGMAVLKQIGHRAATDQWNTARYRAAGFVILGRTNLPELASRYATEPVAYGPTRNPHDLSRTTGGSSGGSAAAVADGWVAAAHATDMGGSIRVPASCCGLVGLKPSRGRTTIGPAFGEYWGQMTHEHVVCRSVRDSAAILDVVAGPGVGDPYTAPRPARPWAEDVGADVGHLRIGVMAASPTVETDPACAAAARRLADRLSDAEHDVTDDAPTGFDDPAFRDGYWRVFEVHIATELARVGRIVGRELTEDDVEPITWELAEAGRAIDAVTYWEATEGLRTWARRVTGWWTDHDLLVTPTVAAPPAPLGEVDGQPLSAFTLQFNVTGQPAMSVPGATSPDGLPVGAQLVGAYSREDLVIAAASVALD